MGKTRDNPAIRPQGGVLPGVSASRAELRKFCSDWRVLRLSFYGTVLESPLSEGEPVRCIVEFEDRSDLGLAHYAAMVEALEELLGRPVLAATRNLVERQWGEEARRETAGAIDVVSR